MELKGTIRTPLPKFTIFSLFVLHPLPTHPMLVFESNAVVFTTIRKLLIMELLIYAALAALITCAFIAADRLGKILNRHSRLTVEIIILDDVWHIANVQGVDPREDSDLNCIRVHLAQTPARADSGLNCIPRGDEPRSLKIVESR